MSGGLPIASVALITAGLVVVSDAAVVRDVGRDRLVLTACHPLYSDAQRYVVFAKLEAVAEP
jgi:sortase A